MNFADVHCHILPGFDDGARTVEESLAMARAAAWGGSAVVAATPHYDCESPGFEPRDVAEATRELGALLEKTRIPVELAPGMEVRVNAGLFELAREGGGLEELCLGEGARYILVDLPLVDIPVATPEIFFQVQLRGVTPVLAHPERNRYLVEHPEALRDLVERGVEVQVDAGSLAGVFGRKARKAARLLLKEEAAKLVASDAHGALGRGPDLSDAARALERLLGEKAVRTIMEVNPRLVLAGESMSEPTTPR